MKVAISSDSFARTLAAGDLTQLEWLAGSASTLGADGVVFARAHFPRTDRDYLAQLRKVAIDLGLVPLAIDEPRLFAPQLAESERRAAIELAAGIGALFVLTVLPPPGEVPPAAFVAAVGAAKAAVKAAKAVNITLLAGAAPGTLGEDAPALRHFLKDVDSAWLRYALPAGADRSALGARDRALVVSVDPGADLEVLAEIDEAARPWLLLTGDVSAERVGALRRAGAKKTLATGVS
jgi:sugar phosphate isomerase/epimerase